MHKKNVPSLQSKIFKIKTKSCRIPFFYLSTNLDIKYTHNANNKCN